MMAEKNRKEENGDEFEYGECACKHDKLRDFYKKAKEFTMDVGQKISKQASIQKKNVELIKLQDDLAGSYRLLGEQSFGYFKKHAPADGAVRKIIVEIKKLQTEIKGLKIKIGREKAGK